MAMAQAVSGKRRSFYADLDKLRSHFDSLDTDKTGYIGYSELKQLVQKMSGIEEAVLPELMEKLDRDNDGKVSFDDFQALFEVERESMSKKMKISPSKSPVSRRHGPTSPTSTGTGRRLPEIPTVVLRDKPGRSRGQPRSRDFGHFSPIHAGSGRSRPPSSEYADPGPGQMQYLVTGFEATDTASPQLKHNSKVLSFFSEAEDVLEGTGDGFNLDNTSEIPLSPPMSPTRGSDEVSHVVSVLKSVIEGTYVDKEAIAKLCSHVNADHQEQQELLSLLSFLDKKKLGRVSIDEFARALQTCKNSAAQVADSPFQSPFPMPPPRRHTISTMTVPRLSEPFTTPVHSAVRQASTPLNSTPLHQPAYSNIILTVLDPENSGYMKVDSLVEQIQEMGVETEHNSSLEEALAEAVTVDPNGRVSVTEFTTSLEGALLTEGKSNNFLRQIALKTFHSEIHNLRSQVHQVSLERDTLQQNLNRTLDENKKLVQMGEEHVDMVTKESEMKLKKQEDELKQRLKDTERSRREEQLQIEDRYSAVFGGLQEQLDKLKSDEETLRADLKLAQEENTQVTNQLHKAHKELSQKEHMISTLQKDLESRSDYDLIDDEHQQSRIQELENDIADKGTIIHELQEKLMDTLDRFDLLTAENEKMKQKYLTAKRDLQRRRSRKLSDDKSRPRSGYSPSKKPKRPLSGAPYGRSSPIKPRIFGSPLDLAIGSEAHHPVLYEDMDDNPSSEHSEAEPVFSPVEDIMEEPLTQTPLEDEVADADQATTSTSSTATEEESTGDDDAFARSNTSLMEEITKHEQKSLLENKIQQLEQERRKLQAQYQQLEQQLRDAEEEDKKEMLKEIQKTKEKQAELDRLIGALEKQKSRLHKTRMEIDSRLQTAEQNLASQLQGLRSSLTENSGADSTGNLADLIGELDAMRDKLEQQRERHEDDLANLKLQLSKAEEDSYSQIDQSLKLEEEKAQVEELLASLQATLESERVEHKAEVDILCTKLDNAEQELIRLKDNENESLQKLVKELEQSREEIGQYKERTEELKRQLTDAQERLGSIHTEPSQASHTIVDEQQQPTGPADLSMTQSEIEALLQQLTKSHIEAHELRSASKQHLSQVEKLQAELEEHKKQSDVKIAVQQEQFKKEIEISRAEYEMKLAKASRELEASHVREKEVKERLSQAQIQFDTVQAEVEQVSVREANHLKQIQVLEESESTHKQEILQLRADIKKYQAQLQMLETTQKKTISDVSTQPKRSRSPRKSLGEDEVDFVPAPIYNPRKLSTGESHEKIIDQMKDQLEELQRVLVLQSRNGKQEGDPGLKLVQDLIASNEALGLEVQRVKQSFDEEQQKMSEILSAKDKHLKELQLQAVDEKNAMRSSAQASTQDILGVIGSFNSTSNESLSAYRERVEEAAAKLAHIRQVLQEREGKHLSSMDNVMSDLKLSREESDSYKLEIERLKQELDSTQRASSVQHPQERRRVDEESGQIVHHAPTEAPVLVDNSLVTQQREEIQNLKDELEKARRDEQSARLKSKDVETELAEKERQLQKKEQELATQVKKVQDLELKLQTPSREQVVMNEALLLNTNADSRERLVPVNNLQMEPPAPVEVDEEDKASQEQMATALQAAKDELEAFKQFQRTLEMQHQQAMVDAETKYEMELSATNEVIDEHTANLRDLYLSVVEGERDREGAQSFTHSQLVGEIGKEVDRLKSELANARAAVNEMELSEAQIQTEHEEEVRALHQQKQQLARQLEEAKQRYHHSMQEQDKQNNTLVQDLVNAKSDLEKQLRQKTEESLLTYQHVGELLDEKKVLIDIIEHLCGEAGKLIDIV